MSGRETLHISLFLSPQCAPVGQRARNPTLWGRSTALWPVAPILEQYKPKRNLYSSGNLFEVEKIRKPIAARAKPTTHSPVSRAENSRRGDSSSSTTQRVEVSEGRCVFHARICLPVSVPRALLNFCHVSVTHAVRIVTGAHRNDSASHVGVLRDDACARGECIPGIFQFIALLAYLALKIVSQNSDFQICWPAYDRWGIGLSLRSPYGMVEMHHGLVRTCTWYVPGSPLPKFRCQSLSVCIERRGHPKFGRHYFREPNRHLPRPNTSACLWCNISCSFMACKHVPR